MIVLIHVGLHFGSVGDIVYPMQGAKPTHQVNASRHPDSVGVDLLTPPAAVGGIEDGGLVGAISASVPIEPPKIPDRTRVVLDALTALRSWVNDLQNVGHAENPHPGQPITLIHNAVARRFCIGIVNRPGFSEVFLGVPSDATDWFPRLPWFHVAIVKGSSRLNFLCEHIASNDLALDPFSLSLSASDPKSIQHLLSRKSLNVREILPSSFGIEVGEKVLCAIDVVEAASEHSIEALKAGRVMTGVKSRSPFSKVSK